MVKVQTYMATGVLQTMINSK